MSSTATPTRVLSALALCLLTLGAFAPLSAGERSGSLPLAHAARTISLNETGRLHLTSKHNFTLNEQGSATGTVKGTIYVHLTAVSSTRVTAEINIYAHGASFSGNGNASYHRGSTTASFAGSMSINRGTGTYAHVHGSGLSFSGTIAESSNDAITVHVSGRVSA
ncbi:MAG: hypothetical protein WB709_09350 [Solirubrobacteraceae bacterium]